MIILRCTTLLFVIVIYISGGACVIEHLCGLRGEELMLRVRRLCDTKSEVIPDHEICRLKEPQEIEPRIYKICGSSSAEIKSSQSIGIEDSHSIGVESGGYSIKRLCGLRGKSLMIHIHQMCGNSYEISYGGVYGQICQSKRQHERLFLVRQVCCTKVGIHCGHNVGVKRRHRIGVQGKHRIGIKRKHRIGVKSSHRVGVQGSHRIGVQSSHRGGGYSIKRLCGLRGNSLMIHIHQMCGSSYGISYGGVFGQICQSKKRHERLVLVRQVCCTKVGIHCGHNVGVKRGHRIGVKRRQKIGVRKSHRIGVKSSHRIGVQGSHRIGVQGSHKIRGGGYSIKRLCGLRGKSLMIHIHQMCGSSYEISYGGVFGQICQSKKRHERLVLVRQVCCTKVGIHCGHNVGVKRGHRIGVKGRHRIGVKKSHRIGVKSSHRIGVQGSHRIGVQGSHKIRGGYSIKRLCGLRGKSLMIHIHQMCGNSYEISYGGVFGQICQPKKRHERLIRVREVCCTKVGAHCGQKSVVRGGGYNVGELCGLKGKSLLIRIHKWCSSSYEIWENNEIGAICQSKKRHERLLRVRQICGTSIGIEGGHRIGSGGSHSIGIGGSHSIGIEGSHSIGIEGSHSIGREGSHSIGIEGGGHSYKGLCGLKGKSLMMRVRQMCSSGIKISEGGYIGQICQSKEPKEKLYRIGQMCGGSSSEIIGKSGGGYGRKKRSESTRRGRKLFAILQFEKPSNQGRKLFIQSWDKRPKKKAKNGKFLKKGCKGYNCRRNCDNENKLPIGPKYFQFRDEPSMPQFIDLDKLGPPPRFVELLPSPPYQPEQPIGPTPEIQIPIQPKLLPLPPPYQYTKITEFSKFLKPSPSEPKPGTQLSLEKLHGLKCD